MKLNACANPKNCPWSCTPITGMWDKETNLYGTDCLLYRDCPRENWTEEQWTTAYVARKMLNAGRK